MTTYLHSILKARPGRRFVLMELAGQELKAAREAQGWRLVGLYSALSGSVNSITAYWEATAPDAAARGVPPLCPPEQPELAARIADCCAEEVAILIERCL